MEQSKPSPYIIIIENKSDEIQNAILFGGKQIEETVNFGCDKGIQLSTPFPSVTYLALLQQSYHKPCKIENTQVYSTTHQLALPLNYKLSDTSDKERVQSMTMAINLNDLGGYAMTAAISSISGDSEISLTVLPKTIVIVKLYPSPVAFETRTLEGAKAVYTVTKA